MTGKWGLQVTHLSTGARYWCEDDVKPDPLSNIRLVSPFTLSGPGFDPFNWPGPLAPTVATITLWARTAADVPDWSPGDAIGIWLASPGILASLPGTWHTYDYTEDLGAVGYDWAYADLVVSQLNATTGPEGGLLVTITCVDALTAYAGETTDLTAATETAALRVFKLEHAFTDSPIIGVGAYPGAGTVQVGPAALEQVSIVQALNEALAGATNDITPSALAVAYAIANHAPGAPAWVIDYAQVSRSAPDATPYRLVLVNHVAVRQLRPGPVSSLGEEGPDRRPGALAVVDACNCPAAGVQWAFERGTNNVTLDAIKADGSAGRVGARFSYLVNAYGPLTRNITSQALYGSGQLDKVTGWYLGDDSAARGRWNVRTVVIDTNAMSVEDADAYAIQLTRNDSPDVVMDKQIAVVGVSDAWGLTPDGGDVLGTLVATQYSIASGQLTITATVDPEVPRPSATSTAVTYQRLKDSVPLAPVQYHGAGTQDRIDPTLTYRDLRVIGV